MPVIKNNTGACTPPRSGHSSPMDPLRAAPDQYIYIYIYIYFEDACYDSGITFSSEIFSE